MENVSLNAQISVNPIQGDPVEILNYNLVVKTRKILLPLQCYEIISCFDTILEWWTDTLQQHMPHYHAVHSITWADNVARLQLL